MPAPSLPYFDHVLQRLAAGDPQLERCFGTHVHWGYWQDPDTTRQRARQEFPEAAEALTRLLLDQAQLQAGQSVLDVGCGFGGTIASLKQPGATVCSSATMRTSQPTHCPPTGLAALSDSHLQQAVPQPLAAWMNGSSRSPARAGHPPG